MLYITNVTPAATKGPTGTPLNATRPRKVPKIIGTIIDGSEVSNSYPLPVNIIISAPPITADIPIRDRVETNMSFSVYLPFAIGVRIPIV